MWTKQISGVFLTLFISLGVTKSQTISGFVREAATGEPLSYVNVFVKDTYKGAATNQDGYYVITDIPPGEYEVTASIIGYRMKTEKVLLGDNQNVRLNFRLEVSVIPGEEVNVTAERQKFREMVEPSVISLDMREIEVAPAFVEADVFRTLQLLPGVQTINDFSSALYVRGSTPDQNLIMLDGITIYNPYHLGGIFSTFNTDAIKEANFQAGGFPARYGGRMGSILNIINREGNTEEITGKANISLISSKVLIEGPIPKLAKLKGSWMLAGRRTYFDKIVDGILFFVKKSREDDPYYDPNDYIGFPYYFYDLEGKLNLDIGENHRVTWSSFYGDDVLYFEYIDEYTYSSEEEYEYSGPYFSDYSKNESLFDWRWGNRTNSLTWRWIVSPKLVAKTFLADSRFRFRIDMDAKSSGTYLTEEDTTRWKDDYHFDVFDIVKDRTVETEIVWIPNDNHTMTAGFQHKNLTFNLGMTFGWGYLENDTFQTFQDTALWMIQRPMEQSLYFQDKWRVSQRLSAQLGARVSRYSLHDRIYFEPRFGLKYLLTDDLAVKLNWGRYHQFLTTANPQDENFRFIDIWLGIPEDKVAPRADHSILGVEYLSPKNILFRVEGYYKDFDHLITLKQGDMFEVEEGEIRFDPFNEFLNTDAYAYGLEFLAKKTTGKIRGWIGYTFAKTKWKTSLHGWYYPKYDRTHTMNVVADWQLTERIHFSTAISYSSGNPFTPIIGRYETWREDRWDVFTDWWLDDRYLVGKKNSERYPPYFRWDISFVRRKPFRTGFREWYFEIINVTNHLNTFMYFYEEKYNPRTDQYEGVQQRGIPMFPIIPTFGIRFEF
ncbi:MAG: TonB-dependent receptor [Candidatus Marinimicrobia bacterium]|nr:TonB-dependent receptor [Candidatus Neomarinimicrobiota bacterium]